MINLYSQTTKKIRIAVFSVLVLVSLKSISQGWSFSAQLAYSGYCPGAPSISLPTITGFQTQAQCEATRQYVLSIGVNTGTCSVYYKCTPCTGSDIVDPNTISPGNVSTDGKLEGKPLFTPHANKAMEDYGKNYKQSKESLKNNQKLKIDQKSSSYGTKRVPNSGNRKLDESYMKKSQVYVASPNGKKPTTVRSEPRIQKGYEVGDPSVVDLTHLKDGKGVVDPNDLTSSKQQAEADKWYKEHSIVYSELPANEGLTDANGNPVMGYDEAAVRVWLDNQEGLRGIIAAFAVNVLDGDIDLLNKAINAIRYGSPEEQSKLANEALSGSVAINAAKKTAYDKTLGAMVDVGKKIFGLNTLLKSVNGAEEVHDVFQFGIDVEEKRNGN